MNFLNFESIQSNCRLIPNPSPGEREQETAVRVRIYKIEVLILECRAKSPPFACQPQAGGIRGQKLQKSLIPNPSLGRRESGL
jgi:hypothetical protein